MADVYPSTRPEPSQVRAGNDEALPIPSDLTEHSHHFIVGGGMLQSFTDRLHPRTTSSTQSEVGPSEIRHDNDYIRSARESALPLPSMSGDHVGELNKASIGYNQRHDITNLAEGRGPVQQGDASAQLPVSGIRLETAVDLASQISGVSRDDRMMVQAQPKSMDMTVASQANSTVGYSNQSLQEQRLDQVKIDLGPSQQVIPVILKPKSKGGRPPGSKNKPKPPIGDQSIVVLGVSDSAKVKSKGGRPKGSKNKIKSYPLGPVAQQTIPSVPQEIDFTTGRPPRKSGEQVNYNVKESFKKMRESQSLLETSTPYLYNTQQHGAPPYLDLNSQVKQSFSQSPPVVQHAPQEGTFSSLQMSPVKSDIVAGANGLGEQEKSMSSTPSIPSQPPKRKRGRPTGSVLVNGKVVFPDGFQPVDDGRSSKQASSQMSSLPVAGQALDGDAAFGGDTTAASPKGRKRLKKGPIVRRSFGGDLPTINKPSPNESLTPQSTDSIVVQDLRSPTTSVDEESTTQIFPAKDDLPSQTQSNTPRNHVHIE